MTEKKLEWETGTDDTEEGLEKFYMTFYEDKSLVIQTIWKSKLQATVKAHILINGETDEDSEIQYYYTRTFVGAGKKFYDKIWNIIKYKMNELELIVKEEDFI